MIPDFLKPSTDDCFILFANLWPSGRKVITGSRAARYDSDRRRMSEQYWIFGPVWDRDKQGGGLQTERGRPIDRPARKEGFQVLRADYLPHHKEVVGNADRDKPIRVPDGTPRMEGHFDR